jgi:hypothetical protein
VPLRATLALIVVLVVVAGCGGGSTSSGGQTITVPSGSHGVYDELRAILDQLPYQSWYTHCVVAQVKKVLTPAEAEALGELPEADRDNKAFQVIAGAGPTCERDHDRPVVDPNATAKELGLLRAGYANSETAVARSSGATPSQAACVEKGFEQLPDKAIIGIANASKKTKEGILRSVFEPCASSK